MDSVTKMENNIFKKAGKRSTLELTQLILEVSRIFQKEKARGRGKLKNNIGEIVKSPTGSKYFREDKIGFLPKKNEKGKNLVGILIGDTHGDSLATYSIVKQIKFLKNMIKDKNQFLIYLGDYADRGRASLRNLEIVLALKKFFPQNVILMRGNHEDGGGFSPYEFPWELINHFGEKEGEKLHQKYVRLFEDFLNLVVTANGLAIVHGGLPDEEIKGLGDLLGREDLYKQMRWSDPTNETDERLPNLRGFGTEFGRKAWERFMKALGVKVMVRSHQYPPLGSEQFFRGRLITIFSNGTGSSESGYQGIVEPKFLKINLSEKIDKIKNNFIQKINYQKLNE